MHGLRMIFMEYEFREKIISAPKTFASDFKNFIKEYKVLSVAIAFVMGGAVNELVKSFVNNIFMPVLSPIISGNNWQTATFSIGSITISYGQFLAAFLNFLILAVVIFVAVKYIMKEDKP